jgi:DNA sulfur modification protein DndB
VPVITVIENVSRRVRTALDGSTQEYYLGQLPSSVAYDATFVPVIKEEAQRILRPRIYLQETDDGYQRAGSSKRMESFARYMAENELRFTPAVVLSGRNHWKFDEASKTLTVTAPAAIIDGQHRLGGYIAAYQNDGFDRLVDFVVMNVSNEEEKQLFLDINSNAKSVPTGIVSVLGRTTGSLVAEELNTNPDSIFRSRLFISQKSPGTLFNIASVAKEVGTTFDHGVFEDIRDNVDLMFAFMSGYWEIIAAAFPSEWEDIDKKSADKEFKLLELTGLMAFSLAASQILVPAFNTEKMLIDFNLVEEIVNYIAQATDDRGNKELDLSKTGMFEGRTGFGGAGPINARIQQIVAKFFREN